MNPSLMFLGLIRRSGNLIIGEESCGIAARSKKAKVILTASDASRNSITRAANYAQDAGSPRIFLPYSKAELGSILGRGTPGMLAVSDISMAEAFVEKLSAEYPGKYEAALSTLKTSYERAAQRAAEEHRHIENIRRGGKKRNN